MRIRKIYASHTVKHKLRDAKHDDCNNRFVSKKIVLTGGFELVVFQVTPFSTVD